VGKFFNINDEKKAKGGPVHHQRTTPGGEKTETAKKKKGKRWKGNWDKSGMGLNPRGGFRTTTGEKKKKGTNKGLCKLRL